MELAGSGFIPFLRATYSQPFGQESGYVLERECQFTRLYEGERVEESITVPMRVVRQETSVRHSMFSGTTNAEYRRAFLRAPLDTRVRGESFSATQLMTFRRDPAEYYRVYYMGLPPSDDNGFPARAVSTESEPDIVAGTLAGELIHETLSRFREWWTEQGEVEEAKLEYVITDVIANQEIAGHDELRERVRGDVTRTMQSSWLQSHRTAMNGARCEYTLTMPMDDDFLTGTMDMILPVSDGNVEIWDWKTNRLDQRSSRDWLEYYELQLQVYCCLLAELYPEQQEFRARLIFTRDASEENIVLRREQIAGVRAKIQQLITNINDMNFGTLVVRNAVHV